MKKPPYTRRHLLATVGALGALPLVTRGLHLADAMAATAPLAAVASCVLSPEMTEGPYFIDEHLNRADLTTGTSKPGVVQGLPLVLNIDLKSIQASGCVPVAGMLVDIWHADASGEYSDIGNGAGQSSTKGQTWLRGSQTSNANGRVTFKTIYPGGYLGRTVHIHVKTRLFNPAGNMTYEFTSQLFFDDAVNEKVMAQPPYNTRGVRSVGNARDGIYRGNASALVDLTVPTDGSLGHVASVTLGLNLKRIQSAG